MTFTDLARSSGRVLLTEFGRATARIRVSPDFLIIGAKRAGTTSLYRYLEQHPRVAPLFPSANLPLMRENQKGVHYFDTHAERSLSWYHGHFPTRAAMRRHSTVVGEASPYYLFHPRSAERAHHAIPTVKVIALLRNPVERTYSAWSEQRRNGIERMSFRDALAAESERVGSDEARLADGTIRYSFAHEFQTYAAQSQYATSLTRWHSLFGAAQLLVLRSEDLYLDVQGTLNRVSAFLQIAPHPLRDVAPWNATTTMPIEADLAADLADCFRQDQQRVHDEFGIAWT